MMLITKRISNNQNFKNGVLYTLFSFANNGISFFLLLLLANYLTPSEYGQLNLFTKVINIISIFISLCTISYISVAYFQKTIEILRQIIMVGILTSTLMLVIFSILIFSFPLLGNNITGIEIKYLWIALLICYFQIYNNINLDIWRLEEKPKNYGIYGISFAISNFIMTFIFVVAMNWGWEGRVYSWMTLSIIYFFISITFLIRRGYLTICLPNFSIIKETYIYALPLVPHLASYWIKQGMDQFIINYNWDSSIVGYYSFAMNFSAIITMIGVAFNSTNSVYIFKKLVSGYNNCKQILIRQCRIMFAVFWFVCFLVIISTYILIKFFLVSYSPSLEYIIPLCVGATFHCVYLLWVNYLFFYKRTQLLMWLSIISALIQFPLSIYFTRYSCFYTSIISMLISGMSMLLVYWAAKKILKNQ